MDIETTRNAHPEEIAFSMTRELFNKMVLEIMKNWPVGSRVLFIGLLKNTYCEICGGVKEQYAKFGGCGCEQEAPKSKEVQLPHD